MVKQQCTENKSLAFFVESVTSLLKEKNISKNKLLTDLGLDKNAFEDWSKSRNIPNPSVISAIADYLDCSIDCLVNGNNQESKEFTINDYEITYVSLKAKLEKQFDLLFDKSQSSQSSVDDLVKTSFAMVEIARMILLPPYLRGEH